MNFVQLKHRGGRCSGKAVNFTREIPGSKLFESASVMNEVLMFVFKLHSPAYEDGTDSELRNVGN